MNKYDHMSNFDNLQINIASPEDILSWSYGEVTKPETINYRTLKSEKDGLFCSRIFGPTKDYECQCGKYKRYKHKGVVCEKCHVEVTESKVRRSRMGHIKLASPVAHIWFAKSIPSRIALLLDLSIRKVDSILYFEKYVVLDPGTTAFERHQLISISEYVDAMEECIETCDSFQAGIGAEAIKQMLSEVNLEEELSKAEKEVNESISDIKKKKALKRLSVIKAFIRGGNKPEWMIMEVLPVLPPDLRPLVPLEGGRFAVSDLNDLYRRVINRNNRLKRLIEVGAPEIILRNEKRMLQESVYSLFDNSRRARPVVGMNKRPLKSLSDSFRGKQSRFRQNLLGKRVDYSARSVIIVGPDLKLYQCGIPRQMAVELFRPFIFAELQRRGFVQTLQAAKKMLESGAQQVWDVLEDVVKGKLVLLNRAPTLHRQSIQAFEPVLIDGKAIQLHPLVCSVFNADFDGDQMAVHLPLSLEAQAEARMIMISSKNIRSPANGDCSIIPGKDIILGLYYLTYAVSDKYYDEVFSSIDEVVVAFNSNVVDMHANIKCAVREDSGRKVYETTPGRCVLYSQIGKCGLTFDYFNIVFSSKMVKNLFKKIDGVVSDEILVHIADVLKDLGFYYATKSGISFGKDDMIIPAKKAEIISEADDIVRQYREQCDSGLLSESERYNKVVGTWSSAIDNLLDELIGEISSRENGFYNDIYLIQNSGARGSKEQMRQLCAARGVMTDVLGNALEIPIKSSFREGLTVAEYFSSTAGGRKTMTDTAIKTADAGYLTRRLVDVAEDVRIMGYDCETEDGIYKYVAREGGEIIVPIDKAVYGRFAAEDIFDKKSNKVICKHGDYIDKSIAQQISEANIEAVKVRSSLMCKMTKGDLCVKCYGLDFARAKLVSIYESVGILAAQSISEPSTQLTMRSFHTGGTAKTASGNSRIFSDVDCTVKLIHCKVFDKDEGHIVVSHSAECLLFSESGLEIARYKIPYGSDLFAKDGDLVSAETIIASWDPYVIPVVAENNGTIVLEDLIEGVSFGESVDDLTGISVVSVLDWRKQVGGDKLKPRIKVISSDDPSMFLTYYLSPETIILMNDGAKVAAGEIIAKQPKEITKSADITGGLARVSDLFEMKKQKDVGVMIKSDGLIKINNDLRNKNITVIRSDGGKDVYSVPKNKNIIVHDGSFVRKGDLITNGEESIHDILSILGVEAVANFFINEIQSIYRSQGIDVNDKHFEVLITQMLRFAKITEQNDSEYMAGDVIDIFDCYDCIDKLTKEGKTPPKYERIIEGITRASLEGDSFMAAAAFRDATRILTNAATNGLTDNLTTKKAAAIVGFLMDAGTGSFARKWKRKARILQNESFDKTQQSLDEDSIEE